MAGSSERRRISILGVPLDTVRPEEARAALRAFLADSAGGHCRHVVTLNPEYVMMAHRNRAFAEAIGRGDLIVADGVGVAVAARLLGGGGERVTGTDLVEWLAAESGPLFLLGGGLGVAEDAARQLLARIPEVRIAGLWGGGTAAERDDEETMAWIRASGARAVLVAYGAPGQVLWIDRNRSALAETGVRLAIGIGGVLDFLAGSAPRAPTVVRRAGLEWLYRLIREPWRWRRQVVLPVFFIRVLIEWIWRRGNRAGKIARPKSS